MLAVIGWLLLAALLLLFVPLRLTLEADPRCQPRFRVQYRWLFGLVRGQLLSQDAAAPRRAKKRKRRAASSGGSFQQWLAFLDGFGGISRVQQLVRDLVTSLDPEVLHMRIDVGLDDPADTGRAWALLGPTSAWLRYRYAGRVVLEPSFAEPALAVEGRARLTFIPLRTLAVLLGYAASAGTVCGLYRAAQVG